MQRRCRRVGERVSVGHFQRGAKRSSLRANAFSQHLKVFLTLRTFNGVKRRFRVRDNSRFQEIRRKGRSFSSRIAVLCILENRLSYSRFGFSVSRRIGNAVLRNRVKRRMRESVRLRMDQIRPGWDCVVIARTPIRNASYGQIDEGFSRLFGRAKLHVSAMGRNEDRAWER